MTVQLVTTEYLINNPSRALNRMVFEKYRGWAIYYAIVNGGSNMSNDWFNEMTDWLYNNMAGRYAWNCGFWFEKEEDAILFKLRWN